MGGEQISLGGHNFEVQITPSQILFFHLPTKPATGPQGEILHSHVRLGSAAYSIHRDLMNISSGSITLPRERFRLNNAEVAELELVLLGKAAWMVREKHPQVENFVGGIHDHTRNIYLDAEMLVEVLSRWKAHLRLIKRMQARHGKATAKKPKPPAAKPKPKRPKHGR